MMNSKLAQFGLLILIVIIGAVLAASFPEAEQLVVRLTVIAGAAMVLNLWATWSDERSKKKQSAEGKDDAS